MSKVFCMIKQRHIEVGQMVKSFKSGGSLMSFKASDFYVNGDEIFRVDWGNGYQGVYEVREVPETIDGFSEEPPQ